MLSNQMKPIENREIIHRPGFSNSSGERDNFQGKIQRISWVNPHANWIKAASWKVLLLMRLGEKASAYGTKN